MGTFILSSTVAAPIYKLNNSAEGFLPFSPCPHGPYDFTQMWNMKNQNKQYTKTNEQTKQNQTLDTEERIMVPRERSVAGGLGRDDVSKGDQLYRDGWDLLAVDHTLRCELSLFSH